MTDATTAPVVVAAAPRRGGGFMYWWDRVSIYLPVLLMVMLALASYWLLRLTPEPDIPGPELPAVHEPDYFMNRFSVKVFEPGGLLKTELHGVAARHFPDDGLMEVDNARVRSFGPSRQLSTASANKITSNDEGTVYLLEGNASVVRQAIKDEEGNLLPRMEFHGEYLRVSTEPEHVMSDQPVLLVRDIDQMTADTLDYQGDEVRVAVLTGRVKAVFAPRP